MNTVVEEYIGIHHLAPHPEGGYYRRLHTSTFLFSIDNSRKASSSVLYLIEEGGYSAFHRIDAEEVWYHHDGGAILLVLLYPDGSKQEIHLGREKDMELHFCVPPGTWMAACPAAGSMFSAVVCHVTPEFLFERFQLAERRMLLARYPQHSDTIITFTAAD